MPGESRTSADQVGDLGTLAEDLSTAALDVARCCARGGTLWTCSPDWGAHGRHVAVEFVHPVVVGKRSLPAWVLEGDDLVGRLRVGSRAGDVLVAIAEAGDSRVRSLMRRAPAWGLTSLWIGAGDRPEPGAADHVLWLDERLEDAAYGGRFVLLYHLLWELSQVCFEHPALLQETVEGVEVCTTCSDEGRLAEIVATCGDGMASARTAAGIEPVDITLLGESEPGDLVVVHAGTAIARVDVDG